MAKQSMKGVVEIFLDGAMRLVKFDFNAICELEDYFGKPATSMAIEVELSVAQVGDSPTAHMLEELFGRHFSGEEIGGQLLQIVRIHTSILPWVARPWNRGSMPAAPAPANGWTAWRKGPLSPRRPLAKTVARLDNVSTLSPIQS